MPGASSDTPQGAFEKHFADGYGYVAYRLAPDFQAAEEVTQEVFLAALESWSSYRGDGTVLSWLRAISTPSLTTSLEGSRKFLKFDCSRPDR